MMYLFKSINPNIHIYNLYSYSVLKNTSFSESLISPFYKLYLNCCNLKLHMNAMYKCFIYFHDNIKDKLIKNEFTLRVW